MLTLLLVVSHPLQNILIGSNGVVKLCGEENNMYICIYCAKNILCMYGYAYCFCLRQGKMKLLTWVAVLGSVSSERASRSSI